MPELTAVHIGLLVLVLLVGAILGWIFRSDRCAREKIAVNAGWQKELDSQRAEHDRLAEQNKSLMEQVSQYQASQRDYSNRAKELSESLKEAFAQRDQLQRQLKDYRGNLEVAIAQRDRLQRSLQKHQKNSQLAALKEKDSKIFHLSRELTSWQSRVPPLVERFQAKNQEVQQLTEELEQTRKEIARLEELTNFDQTRIEPMDADALPDGGDASNEPIAMTATHDTSALQDAGDDTDGEESSAEELASIEDEEEAADAKDEAESSAERLAGTEDPESLQDDDVEDPEGASVDDGSSVAEQEPDHESATEDSVEQFEPPVTDDVLDEEAVLAVSGEEFEPPVTDDEPDGEAVFAVSDEEFEPPIDAESAPADEEDGEQNEDDSVDDTDDLQMIKGIGPSIEKTLNDLGISRFQQLADMSEYEIDRVAQHLRGFRSRIYREDWIGQARDLHYDKSNQRS